MAKIFVILAVCFIGAAVVQAQINKEEALKKVVAAAKVCQEETKAKESDIEDLLMKAPAASMEAKCLRSCLLKNFGVMSADGKFVKSAAMDYAKKLTNGDEKKIKIAEEVVDACGAKTLSDNHCEAAETLENCFRDEAKARGVEKIQI